MKKRLTALLMLACMALSGCTDGLTRSLMVITMGVDLQEGGYTITIKAPNYGATGGGAGGDSKGDENYLNLSVTGKTWEHAMSLLNAAAPRTLRFGQLREIVIGAQTAQQSQLAAILTQIDILQNVRTHAQVIVCDGEAQAFIARQKSAIGKRLSTYLDVTLDSLRLKGYIPTATLSALIRDLHCTWRDPLIAYAAFQYHAGNENAQTDRPVDQLAGTLPRSGTDMGEYVGALAVGAQGQRTLLTGYEVQLYHLLMGEKQSMALGVDEEYFNITARGGRKMRIVKEENREILYLYLPVTAEYPAFRDDPREDVAQRLQTEAEALIRTLQSGGCDALGYGCIAVRTYKTAFEWDAADWPARYQNADVRVEVDVVFRQQGRT